MNPENQILNMLLDGENSISIISKMNELNVSDKFSESIINYLSVKMTLSYIQDKKYIDDEKLKVN